MQITSSSIADGQIQRVHACGKQGGADQPLSLTIRGIPADAGFISIVSDDPDAVKPAGKVWVHWNVFNVPAPGDVLDIRAGEQLSGDVGQTTGGARGYEGMCPPDGVHTYRFAVFASREKLQVDTSKAWTIDDFVQSYRDRIAAQAQITGRF